MAGVFERLLGGEEPNVQMGQGPVEPPPDFTQKQGNPSAEAQNAYAEMKDYILRMGIDTKGWDLDKWLDFLEKWPEIKQKSMGKYIPTET